MASEGWFRKRSKFSSAAAGPAPLTVPDGVVTKCLSCGQILFTKDFEKNLKVCPQCGFHHKLTADERIAYTADEGTFSPLAENLRSVDPLHFPDYQSKVDKLQAGTGLSDPMRIGTAQVKNVPCVIAVSDFRFIGGSMGSVAGEKVVRAMEAGIERNLPVIIFTASGGARMHEGLLSLMQMAKTSAAAAILAQHKIPYVVVMTDPTMAGVLAAYASLGDIIIAEPGAAIGFAGARVAAQASVQKPPPDYQTAEWQLGRGQIDEIVHRRDMPDALASLLMMLGCKAVEPAVSEETVETPTEVTVG
jgi:acetyl-CoA carboxylase carboxyl transferase subunit beta